MIYSSLLAVARTTSWSPSVSIIMIAACLFAVAVGRPAIQNRGVGPKLPVSPGSGSLFEGFGVPELLATLSFGHILGAGIILGLSNAGIL